MAEAGRRTFGRVVLLGLAAAVLAAIGGHRDWVGVQVDDKQAQSLADAALTSGAAAAESPAAGALALVVLACWGVLLVTRGRLRRVVSVLALLSSVGLLVAVVLGWGSVPDAVRRATGDVGAPLEISHGAWFWLTALAAVVSVVATAAAVRLVPTWPEMGSRYDAPAATGAAPVPAAPLEDQNNLELWKSIEEGRDPTA